MIFLGFTQYITSVPNMSVHTCTTRYRLIGQYIVRKNKGNHRYIARYILEHQSKNIGACVYTAVASPAVSVLESISILGSTLLFWGRRYRN